MDVESVFDTDDVKLEQVGTNKQEVQQMSEEQWFILKMELQEFICRTELTEHPAFANKVAEDWMETNGAYFNSFYEEMRTRRPLDLVGWWKATANDDEFDDVNFIQEWSLFKDRQSKH